MDSINWVVIAGVALAAILIVAFIFVLFRQRRRSTGLKKRFGPEYDAVLRETGDPKRAEGELKQRQERVKEYHIVPLDPEEARRYRAEWYEVQSEFVDAPERSVAAADALVAEVMRERGYPMADFEQRAADLSVDHGHVVEHYRAAHALALRAHRGSATTEDLRQAMVHYRALFEDLLGEVDDEARRPTPVAVTNSQ